jgi:hypothetical protein
VGLQKRIRYSKARRGARGEQPILPVRLNDSQPHDDVHARADSTEDCVLCVEPGRGGERDEKLAAVGVWPRICHGKNARARVLQFLLDFVLKLGAKNTFPAAASSSGIASLDHKIFNDTVKLNAIIVATATELGEVQARFRCFVPVQFYCEIAKRCFKRDAWARLEGEASRVVLRHGTVLSYKLPAFNRVNCVEVFCGGLWGVGGGGGQKVRGAGAHGEIRRCSVLEFKPDVG